MKLGTIIHNGAETVIARVGDDQAVALDFSDMEALIAGGDASLDQATNAIASAQAGTLDIIDVSNADWLAPNPKASKILGCAVNNRRLNKVAFNCQSPVSRSNDADSCLAFSRPSV